MTEPDSSTRPMHRIPLPVVADATVEVAEAIALAESIAAHPAKGRKAA